MIVSFYKNDENILLLAKYIRLSLNHRLKNFFKKLKKLFLLSRFLNNNENKKIEDKSLQKLKNYVYINILELDYLTSEIIKEIPGFEILEKKYMVSQENKFETNNELKYHSEFIMKIKKKKFMSK